MSKQQTNYQLLKDVYSAVQRLEDKMDRRLVSAERRIDTLESFKDNLAGKLAIVVGFCTLTASLLIDWLKKRI